MGEKVEEIVAKHEKGLVMVLTGNGKGKTTSALGQAIRAIGHGFKVSMIQFMKGRKYGEIIAAEQYLPDFKVENYGLDSFVMKDNPAPVDIELAQKGLERARELIMSEGYDMIILDEINVVIDFKLISLEEVLEIIKNKPPKLNLVLTGRYAPAEIIEIADMVSEVKEIKHHYAAGIKDRAGIEF
ncbi:MAG: cob(I)yrinic acid a,c-diamide adenosyltransferase [Deltaproteobacteria bacterium]|nr:cob(I)yrinic acid a,c-diamide adenosyltransferase [Deltaproteobacteria bacterium]MBN2846624.1 cob(I)yrinic acid a,c-diamide adenosyltransferase [Deltaproteobacteria bacterium]